MMYRNSLISVLMGTTIVVSTALPAYGQVSEVQRFSIPASDLAVAVSRLRAMGYSVTVSGGATGTTRAVDGTMTVRDALDTMLTGTALEANWSGGSATIRLLSRSNSVADGREIGIVRVAGDGVATAGEGSGSIAQRGANGSSDETATERTRSYAPPAVRVGGKIPRALKDVPQTVSVVTRQQIEDQQLNTLSDVLENTPGVTVLQTGNTNQLSPQFYSRGFEIRNFQIDGGAPIAYGTAEDYSSSLTTAFDMSKYDNVAVLRGADGINAGVGDPGGILSLERKRPVAEAQLNQEYTAGSWAAVRASVDLSAPLTKDRALRVRVVGTHDQRDYFYRTANRQLDLIFGNLEYNPDSDTRFNLGASYTHQKGVPSGIGLARYADGSDLQLPRDTCVCTPWSKFETREREFFVQGERRFGKDWSINVNLNTIRQNSRSLSIGITSFGGVDRDSGQLNNPSISASRSSVRSVQYTADAFITGGFQLFGRRQKLVVGFNYQKQNDRATAQPGDGTFIYPSFPFQAVGFDPAAYPLPDEADFTLEPTRTPFYTRVQYAAYATLQLEPLARLHLSAALRYNWYRTDQQSIFPSFDFDTGLPTEGSTNKRLREKRLLPPTVSVGYDVTPRMRAYASYAGIFQTNATKLTANGGVLAPTTGRTIEAGIKRTDNGGRLTSSIAYFDTLQNNISDLDLSVPGYNLPAVGIDCCYITGGDRRSRGVDASLSGALTPRWQVTLGYTYNTTRLSLPNLVPKALVSQAPKHLFKALTSYRLGSNGLAGKTTIGASGRVQSETVTVGSDGNFTPYTFTQSGYALMDLFARFAFAPGVSLQVNLDNVLDKRYYATIGTLNSGSFYGEPRSVSVALRARM